MMTQDEVKSVVRTVLAVMGRLAAKTRTKADDLMVGILRANEARLAEAVFSLLQDAEQPPSDERVSAALAAVGIRA